MNLTPKPSRLWEGVTPDLAKLFRSKLYVKWYLPILDKGRNIHKKQKAPLAQCLLLSFH
jgi:hypothetical protein